MKNNIPKKKAAAQNRKIALKVRKGLKGAFKLGGIALSLATVIIPLVNARDGK